MDTRERQEARSLLAQFVAGLDAVALEEATAQLRELPLNARDEADDDDEYAAFVNGLIVNCPHCGGYPHHHPSCLVVRAAALLASPDDGNGREDELLDFLLAFVTREDSGHKVWGGIYHDGKNWLCVFCRNWGNVYVMVLDEEQHYDECPVLLAHAFLQRVGQRHPTWPWRWHPEVDCEGGQWERVEGPPH